MGLFNVFKSNKNNVATATNTTATPMQQNSNTGSKQKINLSKSRDDLKTVINLSKEKGVDLTSVKASIVVIMDISGSMEWQYKNGNVQNILTRLFPFALTFDDDGEMEVFVFSNDCKKVPVSMTEANFETFVTDNILGKYYYGGTHYAPPIKQVSNDYKKKKNPCLVFFVTDGDNSDKVETNKAIIASANENCFFEFIGIGNDNFSYLKSLDDLENRSCDNTGFMSVKDFEKANNIDVFTQALTDYVPWLKFKGYLK